MPNNIGPADLEGSCQELMEVGHLEVELVQCNHNKKNGAVVPQWVTEKMHVDLALLSTPGRCLQEAVELGARVVGHLALGPTVATAWREKEQVVLAACGLLEAARKVAPMNGIDLPGQTLSAGEMIKV